MLQCRFCKYENTMPTPNPKIVKQIEQNSKQFSDDIFLSCLDNDYSIASQNNYDDIQQNLQDTHLSLSQYLQAVQLVIGETFAHSVWVKAEIRSLSSKGGHYYFELADKDEFGNITASCRGNLWRNVANSVIKRFENTTNSRLEKGLTILLKVSANFHTQYGFALTILDIDPTYTLGELAQQYQQSLKNLAENGLLNLNKSLAMPFDIQNVLVIAPENGAGLGDFRADADKLHQTGACYFYYQSATFQGNHASDSIRQAIFVGLTNLKNQQISPDLLVIIRGGGAVGDLAYLNDYELSAFIAELPLPVWVGIGHERDKVLIDEIAHKSFDTPSKVIVAIREHLVNITQMSKHLFLSIEQTAKQSLQTTHYQLQNNLIKLKNISKEKLNFSRHSLNYQHQLLKAHSFNQIKQAKQHSEQLRQFILLQHPSQILNKGYVIVRDNKQNIVTSVRQIQPQETLNIVLKDGAISVIAKEIL